MQDGGTEKFPDLFARSVKKLSKKLGLPELGFLYDTPILLEKQRSVLLMLIRREDDATKKIRGYNQPSHSHHIART